MFTGPFLYLGGPQPRLIKNFLEFEPDFNHRISNPDSKYRYSLWLINYDDSCKQDFSYSRCFRFNYFDETTLDSVGSFPPIELRSSEPDESYLIKAALVLDEIRNGRYYQLNLLRYFETDRTPSDEEIATRLKHVGGPYSAWLKLDDLELVSFSPEQFVAVRTGKNNLHLSTYPVKGTRQRSVDLEADQILKSELQSSPKDLAELHMIVDLMRNDFNKICQPGSVHVSDSGTVQSFPHVHHLIAAVHGNASKELTMGDLIRAVCPAGSITGAPKREVSFAISELERRRRGFFMGNLFFVDHWQGELNSSVLIRTMQREADSEKFSYAAGSGLVVKSSPKEELEEITTKCQSLLSRI